jgi:hypothetical protein
MDFRESQLYVGRPIEVTYHSFLVFVSQTIVSAACSAVSFKMACM